MVFGCLPKKPIFEKKQLHIFCGPHFYKKWRWIELGWWCGGFRFHSLNQQKKREFSQAVLLHTWLGHLGYSFLTGGPHGLPYMWFFALQKKATLAKKICLRRGRCHHDIIWNFISVTSDMWSSKELWICASGNGPRNVTVNAESTKMCVCVSVSFKDISRRCHEFRFRNLYTQIGVYCMAEYCFGFLRGSVDGFCMEQPALAVTEIGRYWHRCVIVGVDIPSTIFKVKGRWMTFWKNNINFKNQYRY